MIDCPATREAVWEHEESYGDIGCPICGRDASDHPVEEAPSSDEARIDFDPVRDGFRW